MYSAEIKHINVYRIDPSHICFACIHASCMGDNTHTRSIQERSSNHIYKSMHIQQLVLWKRTYIGTCMSMHDTYIIQPQYILIIPSDEIQLKRTRTILYISLFFPSHLTIPYIYYTIFDRPHVRTRAHNIHVHDIECTYDTTLRS